MSNPMEGPFTEESELYRFITQETRYLILQYILAHPENLPSLEELDHAIPRGKSTIHEHLERLRDRDIVDAYELEPERRSRDLPTTFYGLTEYGIYVVEEFDLLEAKEMLQALYADADKPERIRRYEEAPRPERKSEDELRDELDDLVAREDELGTARKVAGITNLLARDSADGSELDADESVSVRLELGSRLLDLLDSGEARDREAAVSALVGVARASIDVVTPVVPKLADVICDLDLERQRDVVEIFRLVSGTDPDLIPDDSRDALAQLFDRDLVHWQDDLDVAREILETGLAIGAALDSEDIRGTCHQRLGDVARRRGTLDEAEKHYEESLDIAREVGDRHGEATGIRNLGNVAGMRGSLDAAEEYYEESLDIAREVGDRHAEAASLGNLGVVARKRGDLDAAQEYYEESLAIQREVGDRHGEAQSLTILGLLAVEAGNHKTARRRLTEAFELYESIGETEQAVETTEHLAWLASQEENHDEALQWCERGLDLIEESSSEFADVADRLRTRKEELEASDHPDLGSLYRTALRAVASGETDEATRLFREGWQRREDVAPDSEEFQLALSAGVGLLAELRLLDIEETADAEETIASDIASGRDRLTEPAEALFGVLDDESASAGRPDVLTDTRPADEAETTRELEATAYAKLLDKLEEPATLPPHGPDSDVSLAETGQPEPQLT